MSEQAKAQTGELAPVQARIGQSIDESQRVTLFGNIHPLAVGKYDRGPAPVSMPASRLLLVLRRSAQQEAALDTYLQSLQDSASPNFRKWLTPEEFGTRFGVSDRDLATVQTWLQGQGFTINKVARSRMAIEFSGTVGQVQTAFATSIHSYIVNGEQHWANATNPQIPAALEPVIAGLAELNDFVPKSQAIKGPMGTYKQATNRIEPEYTQGDTTNGYYIYLSPADAATIYDTPTSLNPAFSGTKYDGAGVTIGIAADSNIDVTQNANYRTTFGLPANPTTVVVDGEDPGENGDALEAYLDTQVAGGIAPRAKVILYTAQDTYLDAGLYLAIIRALDDNQADILNVSFGACEAALGTSGNQFIYNIAEQAAAQGISVTVSSGDSGSAGCDDPNTETAAKYGLAVNGLASTPFDIAVGGTDFDVLYSNFPTSFTQYVDVTNTLANHRSALSYIPEEPWNDSTYPNTSIMQNVPISVASHYQSNDNIVGGGGGVSSCATSNSGACGGGYPLPAWQSGIGQDTTGRNLPDVSFLAGNGSYGALWGLCTDLEVYASTGKPAPNCVPPTTGNNFIVTGVGGTSAAAPAFAGMLALAEQKVGSRLGQADYVLYKLAKTKYSTVFHDVTTGDNSVECVNGSPECEAVSLVNTYYLSGFNAATGYDEATGLGSVDANQMVSNWSSAALTATNSSLTLNGGTAALNLTHGTAVTVKATVAGSGGTPTGDVALVDSIDPATLPNNNGIGFFTLASGTARGTTNLLPGGSYNLTAHYGGSTAFAASDSNSISVTVNPESSTTTLKVVGYYDPVSGKAASTPYYGFLYLVDAQPYGNSASPSNPNGVATGTVAFTSGSTTLGTAPLASDGVAELQTAIIPGGDHSLKASFPGDASFQPSTSNAVAFTVQPAVSSLKMSTDREGYNAGDPVNITATFASVTGNALDSLGAAPTGTITFTVDGATQLGTAPVTGTAGTFTSFAAASATFTTTGLAWGTHNLTATYSGDSNYAASSSTSPVVIQVSSAAAIISLTPASATVKQNQTLLLTAKLSASGSLPLPTGPVTFEISQYSGQSAWISSGIQLSNGVATVTVPANALPLGPYNMVANYGGDNYYSSSFATASLEVTSSGTVTPALSLTLPSAPVNGALPITLTVTGAIGGPIPTGPVIISQIGGNWSLVNGSASFTAYYPWKPGPNTVTVTYLGDTTYAAASATGAFTQMGFGSISVSPQNPTIYVGDALTLSMSVAQLANLPQPTGTITLSNGSYSSAATPLSSGAASITIPANTLPVGSDVLTIAYSGDPYYFATGSAASVQVTATPPGFTLNGNNLSFAAGATTGNASTITVTPGAGFTGAVALTASITAAPAGAQDPPALSFGATSPVNITGTSAATATLTVSTTASTSSCNASLETGPRAPWLTGGGGVLAIVLLFGIPARRRTWRKMLGGLALLIAAAGGVTACGGAGSKGCTVTSVAGTTPGAYTATVIATAGTITNTATVTITVN